MEEIHMTICAEGARLNAMRSFNELVQELNQCITDGWDDKVVNIEVRDLYPLINSLRTDIGLIAMLDKENISGEIKNLFGQGAKVLDEFAPGYLESIN